MGCRFCATGQLPFQGHLSAGQIVDQVYKIKTTHHPIHNIVYMGMGEPFDNFEEVMRSVHILNDPKGLHIGQRHITLSTCGVPEGILQLAETGLQVRLAVSLHGPDDAVRQELMPMARHYALAQVLEAVRYYQHKTHRRITFEYCLLKGINDAPHHAQALVRQLQTLHAHVNLIEFNSYPGCPYQAPERATLQQFAQVLRQAGVETVIRYRRGRDINAACGQLGALWLENHYPEGLG
jgi:23S rRNA (adenine2503-C2)-methyltransferase